MRGKVATRRARTTPELSTSKRYQDHEQRQAWRCHGVSRHATRQVSRGVFEAVFDAFRRSRMRRWPSSFRRSPSKRFTRPRIRYKLLLNAINSAVKRVNNVTSNWYPPTGSLRLVSLAEGPEAFSTISGQSTLTVGKPRPQGVPRVLHW